MTGRSEEDEDGVAARLARIEEKLDRQAEGPGPGALSGPELLRRAYRKNDEAARAAREAGGSVADQNAARNGGNR